MKTFFVFAAVMVAAAAASQTTLGGEDAMPAVSDEMIARINANNYGWKAARQSRFEGMTLGEVKATLGVMAPAEDFEQFEKDYGTPGFVSSEEFDMRKQWPECDYGVLDQGHCGSCWAFGAAEALSVRHCVATGGKSNLLSPQDLVSCDVYGNFGCNGGMLPATWAYLGVVGIVDDKCFPYTSGEGEVPSCPKKCVDEGDEFVKHGVSITSIRLHFSVSAIMEAIETAGPVECGFFVYEDFLTYSTGVYRHKEGKMLGGHAISLIGWGSSDGEDYWIAQNSWSTNWPAGGEDPGYFKILKGKNECGIEAQCMSGAAKV